MSSFQEVAKNSTISLRLTIVPAKNTYTPNKRMSTSLNKIHFQCFDTLQKATISRSGGKITASKLPAPAPRSAMKRLIRGTRMASESVRITSDARNTHSTARSRVHAEQKPCRLSASASDRKRRLDLRSWPQTISAAT